MSEPRVCASCDQDISHRREQYHTCGHPRCQREYQRLRARIGWQNKKAAAASHREVIASQVPVSLALERNGPDLLGTSRVVMSWHATTGDDWTRMLKTSRNCGEPMATVISVLRSAGEVK